MQVRYNISMNSGPFDSLQQLPIYERREDIVAAVDTNQVTIITAETGAGKSTQVPQFLAEHGYRKIIVTQPRILAARNLSNRVRQEYSWRLSQDATKLVGYRTAHERDDDPDNTILYCTDGLQLVRELTGSGTSDKQVLVLDEIHEWNENMEVLIAWAKKRCAEDPAFKVVLMSATIEAGSLAAYFGTQALISVPGRTYAVEKRYGTDIVEEIMAQLNTRKSNMLVFLPGKAEIESVAEAIAGSAKNVPIIPLHSQLDPETQQLAFANYPQGKVVLTTNVAQTSVTIDDIDTVIDSGLERRAEVRSGVEGLFIEQVSRADCMQRAGRAGRTKEGLYILAPLDRLPCSPLEERPSYGVPEIMRKHIDRLVLRLANIGIDIESLDFYHSPSKKTVKLAKRTLVSLGAINGAGIVTAIGRKMERFPVESSYARMLVEAEQYAPSVQAKLATIIAIQEVGGIVKGSTRYTGWKQFTRQTNSDLLAQYDVFLALPTINPDDFEELGIIGKNATKAEEVNERLNHDLGLGEVKPASIEEADVEHLLRCIVAGQLHQIWAIEPNGEAEHIATKQKREMSSSTVVRHAGLVVGTPFDLQIPTPKGLETLHLVNDVTAVDPRWLEELAPELFKIKPGKVYFDSRYGTLMSRMVVRFNGRVFEASGIPVLEYTPENQKLFVAAYSSWLHEQLEKERHILQSANSQTIPHVPLRKIQERVRLLAPGVVSLLELDKKQRTQLSTLTKLETYVGERFMASLRSPHPQGHDSHTRKHHGWRHANKRRHNRHRD
jgi:HrpA-like RNA helicase